MKLLIITQAVDQNDPALGFFHRWIEEFAARCESIHVLCLREGVHELPSNVSVQSLGKERGAGRLDYIRAFYSFIWSKRGEYNAVFIHMNAEYAVLGGLLWRILRKRVVLWRNHPMGGVVARTAACLANVVCYTSPQAFVVRYKKAVQMPVGIDIAQYERPRTASHGSILSLGRIDPVKRFHLLVAAISLLADDGLDFRLDVYGVPTRGREQYLTDIRKEFAQLEERGCIRYMGPVSHDQTPQIYAAHDVFINLTPAGSFDKTMFEAMAAGCLVVTSNPDLKDIISHELFIPTSHVENIAMALKNALELSSKEIDKECATLRAYSRSHHALSALVDKMTTLLIARSAQVDL